MKKIVLLLTILLATLTVYGQKKTVIRDSKGKVVHVKEKTKDGYILRDANGKFVERVVEDDKEKRTYDATGRLISREKKD